MNICCLDNGFIETSHYHHPHHHVLCGIIVLSHGCMNVQVNFHLADESTEVRAISVFARSENESSVFDTQHDENFNHEATLRFTCSSFVLSNEPDEATLVYCSPYPRCSNFVMIEIFKGCVYMVKSYWRSPLGDTFAVDVGMRVFVDFSINSVKVPEPSPRCTFP